ncbi:utp-glucose-1-phosphate uridylyltransferase [Moniliophthora roreri]|nr:utp-glucose-1-phosphate uridylyltransferase [Moniliophthora roreri]
MTGDVYFGRNVTLRGTVMGKLRPAWSGHDILILSPIVANESQCIDISDGCILENRTVKGKRNNVYPVFFFISKWP